MRHRAVFLSASAVALVLTCLAFLGFRHLEREGRLDLREVAVWGAREVDSASVAAVLAPCLGTPLSRLSPRGIASGLEALPGIDSARVTLDPPDRLLVEITLSRPVLAVDTESGRTAVTEDCEVLPNSFLSDTLPVVAVSDGGDPRGILPGVALWAAREGVPASIGGLAIEGEGLVAILQDGTRIILGDCEFGTRLGLYGVVTSKTVLEVGWTEADMRFRGQVVLRYGQSGEEVPST